MGSFIGVISKMAAKNNHPKRLHYYTVLATLIFVICWSAHTKTADSTTVVTSAQYVLGANLPDARAQRYLRSSSEVTNSGTDNEERLLPNISEGAGLLTEGVEKAHVSLMEGVQRVRDSAVKRARIIIARMGSQNVEEKVSIIERPRSHEAVDARFRLLGLDKIEATNTNEVVKFNDKKFSQWVKDVKKAFKKDDQQSYIVMARTIEKRYGEETAKQMLPQELAAVDLAGFKAGFAKIKLLRFFLKSS